MHEDPTGVWGGGGGARGPTRGGGRNTSRTKDLRVDPKVPDPKSEVLDPTSEVLDPTSEVPEHGVFRLKLSPGDSLRQMDIYLSCTAAPLRVDTVHTVYISLFKQYLHAYISFIIYSTIYIHISSALYCLSLGITHCSDWFYTYSSLCCTAGLFEFQRGEEFYLPRWCGVPPHHVLRRAFWVHSSGTLHSQQCLLSTMYFLPPYFPPLCKPDTCLGLQWHNSVSCTHTEEQEPCNLSTHGKLLPIVVAEWTGEVV